MQPLDHNAHRMCGITLKRLAGTCIRQELRKTGEGSVCPSGVSSTIVAKGDSPESVSPQNDGCRASYAGKRSPSIVGAYALENPLKSRYFRQSWLSMEDFTCFRATSRSYGTDESKAGSYVGQF